MTLALYVPRASPVHRLPAGVKLLCLAVLAVLLFAVPTLPAAGAALLGTLAVGLGGARLPVTVLARQARAVRWWLIALFVVHALTTDTATGAHTVLRLLTLVLAAAVVTATTRVTAMVAVVERLCAPLRHVGVRPARIGLALAMALRFIPYVGPAVGATPPVLIALFSGEPLDAIWLILAFTALQQIEGHIVAPQIFGHTLRINPILVIFALLVGGEIYGIVGALVALPIAAVVRETVVYLRRHLVLEPWPRIPSAE